MEVVGTVNTGENKRGSFCISYDELKRVIAFPHTKRGQIKVRDIDEENSFIIEAHRHPVQCFAMDYMGNVLASASTKGTLIRIFSLADRGKVVQEVRRGIDNAKIMSITFDLTGQLLGVSSDSGTVHIFRMKYMLDQEDIDNQSVADS